MADRPSQELKRRVRSLPQAHTKTSWKVGTKKSQAKALQPAAKSCKAPFTTFQASMVIRSRLVLLVILCGWNGAAHDVEQNYDPWPCLVTSVLSTWVNTTQSLPTHLLDIHSAIAILPCQISTLERAEMALRHCTCDFAPCCQQLSAIGSAGHACCTILLNFCNIL